MFSIKCIDNLCHYVIVTLSYGTPIFDPLGLACVTHRGSSSEAGGEICSPKLNFAPVVMVVFWIMSGAYLFQAERVLKL